MEVMGAGYDTDLTPLNSDSHLPSLMHLDVRLLPQGRFCPCTILKRHLSMCEQRPSLRPSLAPSLLEPGWTARMPCSCCTRLWDARCCRGRSSP